MIVNCTNCDKEFHKTSYEMKRTKNHFCSHSCSASYNNKTICRNSPKPRECILCLKTFYFSKNYRSKYCPECNKNKRTASFYLTLKECKERPQIKDKHPLWLHNYIRTFTRSWNKEMAKLPCKNCGYTKHSELCHIRAVRDWPDSATLGEINSPNNLIPLCPNCHWEFDHGLLIVSPPGTAPSSAG